jgi:hypothetical protein
MNRNAVNAEAMRLRRLVIVVAGGFLAGFVGMMAVAIWFILKYGVPEQGWWALLHLGTFFELAVIAGLLMMVVGLWFLGARPFDGTLRHPDANRPRWWANWRLQIRRVLRFNLVVLPLSMLAAAVSVRWQHRIPFLVDLAILHMCFCVMVGLIAELLDGALFFLHRGEGIRERIKAAVWPCAVWPVLFLSVGLSILKVFGYLSRRRPKPLHARLAVH